MLVAVGAGIGVEAAEAVRSDTPRTIPHSFGFRPGVDLDKLNQLADELEVEALSASLGRQST